MLTQERFEQLFRDYYKLMLQYALRYINDQDAASDIVQEVFLSLWKMRDNFTPHSTMKSYLLSAVYYRSLNYLKHEKAQILEITKDGDLSSLDEFRVYCIDKGSDLKDPLIINESIGILKDAINELPDQCRRAFILSRKLGLKNKEIADFLGISIKVVEKHISKALLLLHKAIKEN
jgi:RNA polymerase sigma-70 factor, ECF subfamily